MRRRAADAGAVAATDAERDAAAWAWPASWCWSWRTPYAALVAAPDQTAHPVYTSARTHTQRMTLDGIFYDKKN